MTRPGTGERGVALLLVLWIFTILGVLALDFARYMRDDAMAAVNLADETRGYYLALAGMNHAIYDAERAHEEATGAPWTGGTKPVPHRDPMGNKTPDPNEHDEDDEGGDLGPADGQWHEGEFGGGRYSVRVTDEGGRISINKADEALLTLLVTNLLRGGNSTTGVDRRTKNSIDTVVDSILDWRDPDNLARLHGAESEYYLSHRAPHRAKNGFFDSPEELFLVRGVTAAIFYGSEGMPGLRDLFSVYTRKDPRVHLRTAPVAVLQVLLGIDAAEAADLVAQRDDDPDGFVVSAQARLDPSIAATVDPAATPSVVTIEARADLTQERNQSRVAVVADIASDTGEGVKILRWLDRAPWDAPVPAVPGGAS